MIPEKYTHVEGGNWNSWPIGEISYNELRKRMILSEDMWFFTNTDVVVICDTHNRCILIHSLYHKGHRWDCLNGWNDGKEPE